MKEKALDVLMLTISAVFTALAVRLFFTEYSLTPGGITGFSITISSLTNIPVDIISLSISVPLLILGTIFLGGKFGLKTLYITIMIPIFIRLIPQIHITDSIIIASIAGGILVGLSIGLAVFRDCATGGTDVIAMLIKKVIKNFDLAMIIFVLDMIIVLSSWYISKRALTSVYSAFTLLVIMQTIKYTVGGFKNGKRALY